MKKNILESRPRFILSLLFTFLVMFSLSFIQIPILLSNLEKLLIAYNIFQWSYLFNLLSLMFKTSHQKIQERAKNQDESANFVLGLSSIASFLTLIAIAFELSSAREAHGLSKSVHLILPAITLLGVWALLPTMYAIHYAHIYFLTKESDKLPVRFPDNPEKPDYFDFLYFSINIAVASQTADVTINSSKIRRLIILQSILSFLFNTSVLALGINVAASLLQ